MTTMSQNLDLTRLERSIADLELRVAEQKGRLDGGGAAAFGSAEVLQLMEQTLESWRERKGASSGSLNK
jgi:hypothetical protein